MQNYNKIINPDTGRSVKTKGQAGIKIIKKYVKQMQHYNTNGTVLYPKYAKINNLDLIRNNSLVNAGLDAYNEYLRRLCGRSGGVTKRCGLKGTSNYDDCEYFNNRCVPARRRGGGRGSRRGGAGRGSAGRGGRGSRRGGAGRGRAAQGNNIPPNISPRAGARGGAGRGGHKRARSIISIPSTEPSIEIMINAPRGRGRGNGRGSIRRGRRGGAGRGGAARGGAGRGRGGARRGRGGARRSSSIEIIGGSVTKKCPITQLIPINPVFNQDYAGGPRYCPHQYDKAAIEQYYDHQFNMKSYSPVHGGGQRKLLPGKKIKCPACDKDLHLINRPKANQLLH